jgi:hypothetical protein
MTVDLCLRIGRLVFAPFQAIGAFASGWVAMLALQGIIVHMRDDSLDYGRMARILYSSEEMKSWNVLE